MQDLMVLNLTLCAFSTHQIIWSVEDVSWTLIKELKTFKANLKTQYLGSPNPFFDVSMNTTNSYHFIHHVSKIITRSI